MSLDASRGSRRLPALVGLLLVLGAAGPQASGQSRGDPPRKRTAVPNGSPR